MPAITQPQQPHVGTTFPASTPSWQGPSEQGRSGKPRADSRSDAYNMPAFSTFCRYSSPASAICWYDSALRTAERLARGCRQRGALYRQAPENSAEDESGRKS